MNNVCVVGYGAIGTVHTKVLERSNHANLYAVCDNNRVKLEQCQKVYEDIVTYDDFDTMLLDEKITAVHICTPHYLHYEMAVKAIRAGKAVVLEKPVTMLPEEYKELKALCDEVSPRLCVMLQNRTSNCVRKMKSLAAELGEIKGAYAALTWLRDMEYYNQDAWRGKLATEGGGVLMNQSIHLLDMLLYICGEAESVAASASTKFVDVEVEDTLDALITLKNGARACYYATNAYVGSVPFRFEVIFEKGTLRFEDNNLYRINGSEIEIVERGINDYNGKACWGNGHESVINAFYTNGEYPTIYDADHTMRTLFAIYESAGEGRKVTL